MIRYNIRVNIGDNNNTVKFFFVHKDYATISEEASNEAFDKAVKELNHVYKDYGRFATKTGVIKLFETFGFEYTIGT